jgi:hypothetical protein
MLKTPLCNLLGIDVPIILAPMGTCTRVGPLRDIRYRNQFQLRR